METRNTATPPRHTRIKCIPQFSKVSRKISDTSNRASRNRNPKADPDKWICIIACRVLPNFGSRQHFSTSRRRNGANSFPSSRTERRDANRASLICLDNDCNYGGELTSEKRTATRFVSDVWLAVLWMGRNLCDRRAIAEEDWSVSGDLRCLLGMPEVTDCTSSFRLPEPSTRRRVLLYGNRAKLGHATADLKNRPWNAAPLKVYLSRHEMNIVRACRTVNGFRYIYIVHNYILDHFIWK